jgi:hypothetical protein
MLEGKMDRKEAREIRRWAWALNRETTHGNKNEWYEV